MRKSKLSGIPASTLRPGDFRFDGDRIQALVCPECGALPGLERRGIIAAHPRPLNQQVIPRRCPNSRRKLLLDSTIDELRDAAHAAKTLAEHRATEATPPPGERRRCTPPPALPPPRKETDNA